MQKNTITIRAAIPDDFTCVYTLIREFAVFQKTPEKVSITPAVMLADKDLFKCLVAENVDGKIVGFATFFFAYYSWSGKALYLDDLYVQQPYRQQHTGMSLLNEVIRYARDADCKNIRWLVSSWNSKAIEFYKKLGAVTDEGQIICELKL